MVKCKDCGFLTVKIKASRELIEADSRYREDGGSNSDFDDETGVFEPCSLCFARAVDFTKEWGANGRLPEVRLRIISNERECDKFTEWQQGFSPKEHAEMIHQEKLLEWQREREEADRAFQEKQEMQARAWRNEDRDWRREDVGLIKSGMTSSVRAQIAVAAIGAIAALAATGFGYWLASRG